MADFDYSLMVSISSGVDKSFKLVIFVEKNSNAGTYNVYTVSDFSDPRIV